MTPSQIIAADAETYGNDPKHEILWVATAIKKFDGIMLREGNTLLVLVPIAPHQAELHLYTQDSPLALYKAMQVFWKKIVDTDLEKVYTIISDPKILQLARRTGWNLQESDNPEYNGMAVVEE